MSERFHTYINTAGPAAETARTAAIEAAPKGEWGEGWSTHEPFADTYFDHDSGETVIESTAAVSRNFPETFFGLLVGGSGGEGIQGPVVIKNGTIQDGRTKECANGDLEPSRVDTIFDQYCQIAGGEVLAPEEALPPTEYQLERIAIRAAANVGLHAIKTCHGFMLYDASGVVAGENFDMDVEDVLRYCTLGE